MLTVENGPEPRDTDDAGLDAAVDTPPVHPLWLTLGALALATALRAALDGVLGSAHPFVTYYAAVVLVAASAGRLYGLLTLLASGVCAAFLFLPRPLESTDNAIALATFAAVNLLTIVILAALQRRISTAQARAAATRVRLQQARDNAQTLLLADQVRARALESERAARAGADTARNELAHTSRLLRALSETIPDLLYVKDRDGRVLFANAAMLATIGRPADAVLGHEEREWRSGEETEIVAAADRQVIEGGAPVVSEEIFRRDGQRRVFLSTRAPLRDDAGAVIGLVGVSTDITDRKEAEEARAEREARVRALADTFADVVWIVEPRRQRTVYISRGFERLCQRPVTELLERFATWLEIVHPDDRERVGAAFAHAFERGGTYEAEYRIVRPDGSERWMLDRGGCISPGPDGEPRMGGLAVDITERTRTEKRLRESEELFSRAFNLSPHVVTITSLHTGRLIAVNDTFVSVTGISREEAVGRSTVELGLWVDARERETELAALRARGQVRNAEYRFRLRNGRIIDGLMSAERIDVRGEPCALTVLTDVSAKKQVERSLNEQLAVTRAITDNSIMALFMIDEQGYCTFCNPAAEQLFGYTLDELRDRPLHDIIHHRHPDGRPYPRSECPLDRALPERTPVRSREEVFFRKSGEAVPVVCAASPIVQDGRPVSTVLEIRDVTTERAAAVALHDADRRKDEFLAMLAHELRNPLAPLRNAVGVLRALDVREPQLRGLRDLIDRQVAHMTRLVDDLLEISRITRDKIELRREPLLLSAIIEEAIESARPLITQRGHELSVVLAEEPIPLQGDRARLVQVIANLLTNAAKFTPPNGTITVSTSRAGAHTAVVRVHDTGIGIPPEAQSRIFDLFSQEDAGLARSQGGLGIGLTLVKRLVELHGGRVSVESRGSGMGSLFTITLPTSGAAAYPPPRLPGQRRRGPGGVRILIVEDNPDAAESFRMLLELDGHEVRVAETGLAAVAAIEMFVPEVAFVDLGLPGIDGFEVARRLRGDPRTRSALLIAVSGYGREEDKAEARRAGFDHHLTKPVDPALIASLVATRAPGTPAAPETIH